MTSHDSILIDVASQYGAVARSPLSNESAAVRSIAQAFGYSAEDLASLPPEANMGLSCGNPVAIAGLKEGEVVVDLGCGGGLDVLLAAQRVGPSGKSIGVDMTPDMIARARAGAAQVGATNVEFHLARIDQLPLPDNSVDCIISNCVINLVPDKAAVFREILRVLKPGGRVVLSDIALKRPLPEEIQSSIEAYVGCIAGAIPIDEYAQLLRSAGFDAVVVQDTGADLNAYAEAGACCSPAESNIEASSSSSHQSSLHDDLSQILAQFNANDYAASVRVHALRPLSSPIANSNFPTQEKTMSTIHVYDKPMCCSTGVCGPDVDPVLPRFAADLDWLKTEGHRVERFNLAQQPQAFIDNAQVRQLVMMQGVQALPIVVIDGQVVSQGQYPSREQLAAWAVHKFSPFAFPVFSSSCCGSSGCC